MMGVFAEFERAMIRERVKSGLERAKAQGKTLGRPPIDAEREAAILADLRAGRDHQARSGRMGTSAATSRIRMRRATSRLTQFGWPPACRAPIL